MVEPGQDLDIDVLNEAIDSFTAEIMSSVPIPFQSAELEEYRGFDSILGGNRELTQTFHKWSMKNQDHFSPEQVKAIKFRHSAIEWATESLGCDMEGKKQRLKVLFEWVECCKRRTSCYPNPNPNPSPSPYMRASSQAYLMNHQQFATGNPSYQQTWDYSHVMDWTQSNPVFGLHSPYVPNNGNMTNPQFQAVNGESSFRRLGEAASKDARMKRKDIIHHRRNSGNPRHHGIQPSEADHRVANGGREDATDGLQPTMGNRETMQSQKSAFQLEDCTFLLRKVLVKTDVGYNPGSGRIMLPKREAESNLPAVETGDRITMAMEEVGTSLVWSMYYRFWLNYKNKRNYILENTGEYARANGLRVGGSIVCCCIWTQSATNI